MAKKAPQLYISPAQLANELGVCDRTVRRWIADGRLRAIRPSQRVIRIHRDEIARFLGTDAA